MLATCCTGHTGSVIKSIGTRHIYIQSECDVMLGSTVIKQPNCTTQNKQCVDTARVNKTKQNKIIGAK